MQAVPDKRMLTMYFMYNILEFFSYILKKRNLKDKCDKCLFTVLVRVFGLFN